MMPGISPALYGRLLPRSPIRLHEAERARLGGDGLDPLPFQQFGKHQFQHLAGAREPQDLATRPARQVSGETGRGSGRASSAEELASISYDPEKLKGLGPLAKLLDSKSVQMFNAGGPNEPSLVTFPGCSGAVLVLMPMRETEPARHRRGLGRAARGPRLRVSR